MFCSKDSTVNSQENGLDGKCEQADEENRFNF